MLYQQTSVGLGYGSKLLHWRAPLQDLPVELFPEAGS